jgi:hypothetical protein
MQAAPLWSVSVFWCGLGSGSPKVLLTCILCKHFRFIYDPRHKRKLIGILNKLVLFTGLAEEHTTKFLE